MGVLELAALAAIAMGLMVIAPRWLGVDPLGRMLRWLNSDARSEWTGDSKTGEVLEVSLDQIDRELKDLGEHIGAVRHLAEERATEVERFREGYNYSVTRSLARGVIKAVDMLSDFRHQLQLRHGAEDSSVLSDAQTRLEATSAQLEMLLEANQIEAFWPETGASIEADSCSFEPVEVRSTTDPSKWGLVAEVKYPGWILIRGETDSRVIREAQVSVYGRPKEETGT